MAKNRHSNEKIPPDSLIRPITIRAENLEPNTFVKSHTHGWGQLAYASQGVMNVITEDGSWTVPPERAVWIPPETVHSIDSSEGVKFRSLHISSDKASDLPERCVVITVSPLLKELIAEANRQPLDYEEDSAISRLMDVIFDQMKTAKTDPLHLPIPLDKRLTFITDTLMRDAADTRTLGEFSRLCGASERTLARLFLVQTRMTFGKWRQQRRLVLSLQRLSSGHSITQTALDLGYDSPSAFTAMFRRALGVSPRQYFKTNSNKD
jgi:AraC-like DNA-binding protein